MPRAIKELGVVVGFDCNFKCAHCCTLRKGSRGLTSKEKNAVISAINSYTPRTILFVGGETTLYLNTVNEILSSAENLSGSEIKVTTNGHFARTVESSVRVLKSFKKLDRVQLSYDRFHAKFLPFENVKNLHHACNALGIRFCVIHTISSPLDLVDLKQIREAGRFRILVNKVMSVGEAARNGIGYKYPSFDKGVLSRSCPAHGNLAYICGRGFSVCCANLMFETDCAVAHASIPEHKSSLFYKLISRKTFGQLLQKAGLSSEGLPPEFSAECNLCRHIFENGGLLS